MQQYINNISSCHVLLTKNPFENIKVPAVARAAIDGELNGVEVTAELIDHRLVRCSDNLRWVAECAAAERAENNNFHFVDGGSGKNLARSGLVEFEQFGIADLDGLALTGIVPVGGIFA